MSTMLLKKFATPVLLGTLAVFAAGCDEDPLEPEEHPEAGGVVIFEEGTRNVLAVGIGQAAFDNPITVPANGRLEVEIFFLNEDDPTNYDRAFLPDADAQESLGITITDETIVGFNFHGDHADFEGKTAGTTTATFDLLHAGHPDFTSGPLTIVVQ